IAEASYGESYEQAVRRIGETHARLGLEPTWYIGGYALVAEHLVKEIVKDNWPRLMSRSGPEAMSQALVALLKAIMLDMDLAITTYRTALEERRQDAERARLAAEQRQTEAGRAITKALGGIAAGDLTTRLEDELAPEFDQLKADFNHTAAALAETLSSVA